MIAVTNDPAGPLARTADVVVPLHAGVESSGIACRSFRATIAALALLAGAGQPRRPACGTPWRRSGRLGWLDETAPAFADVLDGAPSIDILAGASMVGGQAGASMLREAPRLPARAYETTRLAPHRRLSRAAGPPRRAVRGIRGG